MITTSQEPRFSYLRRMFGLAFMACSFIVLTLTIQQANAQQKEKIVKPPLNAGEQSAQPLVTRLPGTPAEVLMIRTGTIVCYENNCELSATTNAGANVKIQFKRDAAIVPGEKLTLEAGPVICFGNNCEVTAISSGGKKVKIEFTQEDKKSVTITTDDVGNAAKPVTNHRTPDSAVSVKAVPLYVLDGKEITPSEMEEQNPNTIDRIDVIKGKNAIDIYGVKGNNGVVIITSKRGVAEEAKEKDVILKIKSNGTKPVYIVDGKEIIEDKMKAISPGDIKSITVIKGENAIAKYGGKAKDGVIEISTKPIGDNNRVFTSVEQPAQFPDGQDGWQRYLAKNLQYPAAALKAGIEGIARLEFIVSESGEISEIKVVSDPGSGIGEEAMRLIRQGPKWRPAVQNGHPVTYKVALSIPFKVPVS